MNNLSVKFHQIPSFQIVTKHINKCNFQTHWKCRSPNPIFFYIFFYFNVNYVLLSKSSNMASTPSTLIFNSLASSMSWWWILFPIMILDFIAKYSVNILKTFQYITPLNVVESTVSFYILRTVLLERARYGKWKRKKVPNLRDSRQIGSTNQEQSSLTIVIHTSFFGRTWSVQTSSEQDNLAGDTWSVEQKMV